MVRDTEERWWYWGQRSSKRSRKKFDYLPQLLDLHEDSGVDGTFEEPRHGLQLWGCFS